MEGPSVMDLPPGFRFHPTDEELISNYLMPKVINGLFSAVAVGEVDLNKCEPWDLPKKAKMGEKEWYFYCNRDRKYPTGMRTNRATESGYWKATGKDKEIYKMGKSSCLIGMKKTLVFYKGRAPKGEKTNWVMHEYRLEGEFSYYKFPNKDEWVVSRIIHKLSGINKNPMFPTMCSPYQYDPHLSECCSTISQLPPLVENPCNSILIDENEVSEGITKPSFPQSIERGEDDYLSYLSENLEDHQLHKHNTDNFILHNYNNHFGMIKPDYSFNFYPQSQFPNQEYLLREKMKGQNPIRAFANQVILRALDTEKQCKEEQLSSNQSMVSVSQDTGISTDMTAETSSRPSDKIFETFSINYPYLNVHDNVTNGFDCLWDLH